MITLLMNSPSKLWVCKALAGNGLDDVIQIPFIFESSDSSNFSSLLGVKERRCESSFLGEDQETTFSPEMYFLTAEGLPNVCKSLRDSQAIPLFWREGQHLV